MSIYADQLWVYKFNDNMKLTYQQEESMLEGLLDPGMVHRDIHAQIDHHERLGNVMANDVVNPFGQTPTLNPANSRRALTLISSDGTVLVSDENTLRSMVNPESGYTRTIVSALRRRADKHIIDALTGTATTAAVASGSGIISYGSQALPTARIIGTGAAITLTNVISGNVILSKGSCPRSGRRALYGPGQIQDIMAITQASSSDFTKNQIHDRGTIDGLMWQGFNWLEIVDVVDIDGSTVLGRMLQVPNTNQRRMVFWHPSCLGVSYGKDLTTVFDPRPDLQSRPTQVRTSMMMAAVRVFEGGVVALDVLEN